MLSELMSKGGVITVFWKESERDEHMEEFIEISSGKCLRVTDALQLLVWILGGFSSLDVVWGLRRSTFLYVGHFHMFALK